MSRSFDAACGYVDEVRAPIASEWRVTRSQSAQDGMEGAQIRDPVCQLARFFLAQQVAHMFYALVFLLFGSSGKPVG